MTMSTEEKKNSCILQHAAAQVDPSSAFTFFLIVIILVNDSMQSKMIESDR